MARRGSKSGVIVKRGAGGRFMGSVKIGGASFGTSQGRIKMRGSGLSLGQLRQQFTSSMHSQAGKPGQNSRSYMEKPQSAKNTLASIKRTPGIIGNYPGSEAHQRQWAVGGAVGARAYARGYKRMKP